MSFGFSPNLLFALILCISFGITNGQINFKSVFNRVLINMSILWFLGDNMSRGVR